MSRMACVPLILALAACGGAQPEPRMPAGNAGVTSTAAATPADVASPAAATSGSDPTPAGRFVRVLGIMDCPGGCPSSTVREALTQPGADVDPGILVDGFLVVHDDGMVLFCEGLTEEATPRCAGERLVFEGQGALELLAGAQWSEELQLLGTVHPEP
jgi:hypothetical protein